MAAQAAAAADKSRRKERQKAIAAGKPQFGSISGARAAAVPESGEGGDESEEEGEGGSAAAGSSAGGVAVALASQAVTADGAAVVAVPRHFRAAYCGRVARFLASLRGQGPASEVGAKVDLASAIPGFSELTRGAWSSYGAGSGDAVRDLAANAAADDSDDDSDDGSDTPAEAAGGGLRAGQGLALVADQEARVRPSGKGGGRRAKPSGPPARAGDVNSGAKSGVNSGVKSGVESRYLGVVWHAGRGAWEVEVEIDGTSIRSGNFAKEVDAARSYDEHAEAHGKPLNFPGEHTSIGAAAWGGRSRYEGLRWSSKLGQWTVAMAVDGVKVGVLYL
jgi:hypothetical protein